MSWYRFGAYLVAEGLGQGGDVITVFFAILVGAFQIGQAGPNLLNLTEARGAATEIYATIDRVSQCMVKLYSSYCLSDNCHKKWHVLTR